MSAADDALSTEEAVAVAVAALVGIGLAVVLMWALAELLRRSFGPEVAT